MAKKPATNAATAKAQAAASSMFAGAKRVAQSNSARAAATVLGGSVVLGVGYALFVKSAIVASKVMN